MNLKSETIEKRKSSMNPINSVGEAIENGVCGPGDDDLEKLSVDIDHAWKRK